MTNRRASSRLSRASAGATSPCCELLAGYPPTRCVRLAKQTIDGKGYCGVHARSLLQRRAAQVRARIRDEQDDEEWGQKIALRRWLDDQTGRKLRSGLSRLSLHDLLAIRELVEVIRSKAEQADAEKLRGLAAWCRVEATALDGGAKMVSGSDLLAKLREMGVEP